MPEGEEGEVVGRRCEIAAFGKALAEALQMGLIERLPKLAAVQAEGASPFVKAFEAGFDGLEPIQDIYECDRPLSARAF